MRGQVLNICMRIKTIIILGTLYFALSFLLNNQKQCFLKIEMFKLVNIFLRK